MSKSTKLFRGLPLSFLTIILILSAVPLFLAFAIDPEAYSSNCVQSILMPCFGSGGN